MDAQRNPNAARWLTIALLLAIAVLLFPYVSGLLGGMMLYVVGLPLMRRLGAERWRRPAAFATVFLLFVVIVMPAAWLVLQLVAQIPDATRSIEQSRGMQQVMATHIGTIDVGTQLSRAGNDIIVWSSRQTVAALGGVVDAMLNLAIALFGAYYLLISGDRVWVWCSARLPFAPATSELLRARFHDVTDAMLIGVALTSVAQGALVGVALATAGFSHALLWGAVTAVAALLPIFGSGLVWGPAVLVLLAHERIAAATVLALFGIVVISNVDNVLRLVVYRRVSHIHPMVTLVGAFAGVRAFGVAGLLLGPLVLSYAIELMKLWAPEPESMAQTKSQGFPVGTRVIPPTPSTAPSL